MIKECFVKPETSRFLFRKSAHIFDSSASKSEVEILSLIYEESELPLEISRPLFEMVRSGKYSAVIFRNLMDPNFLNIPTPGVVRSFRRIDYAIEVLPLMIMSWAGFPIGYQVQQSGKIINDVYPVKEFENVDNSTKGVNFKFNLHTEDAYHKFPPDFLSLFCIRNKEKVKTLVSYLKDGISYEDIYPSLFKAEFINNKNAGSIESTVREEKRPILFGNVSNPLIQMNSARPPMFPNPQSESEFNSLVRELDTSSHGIILNGGDMMILNNQRCAHGRDAFSTTFDNEGRWLLRILSRRDISKCVTEPGSNNIIL